MGVWLGPRGGKPEPIAIYAPGDTNVFTAVPFAVFGGIKKEPGAFYRTSYMTAAIQNQASGGNLDVRSGLLVSGPVDLTKYKKIRFDYTGASVRYNTSARFYVSASADSYDENRDTWVSVSNGSGSLELDVSGLSGTHYVGIELCASGNTSTTTTLEITGITVSAD